MRALPIPSLMAALAAALIVIDGDTVHAPDGERYRLLGIDAAEIGHAGCEAERRLGLLTKDRLETLVAAGQVELKGDTPAKRDVYGRVLTHLIVDGEDAGCLLIKEGYARPWTGHRENWCDPKMHVKLDESGLDCRSR